jgi:hypothetical protein
VNGERARAPPDRGDATAGVDDLADVAVGITLGSR